MKWVARFKDRVTSPFASASPARHHLSEDGNRARPETEQDFRRFWDEFRASSSEKEKEEALEMALEVFCKLSKKNGNAPQLVSMLVDARIFSFVVARALVTDIEKLKGEDILLFFSEGHKDEPSVGMNMLFALEGLVSPPLDVQPLLDADLLSCLVSVLYRLLTRRPTAQSKIPSERGGTGAIVDTESVNTDENRSSPGSAILQRLLSKNLSRSPSKVASRSECADAAPDSEATSPEDQTSTVDESSELKHRLMVEGSVVHIMKALARHPGAAQHLAENDTLHLVFEMVLMGSVSSAIPKSDDNPSPPVHLAQLHRHSLQILALLLLSDNGSTAKYIHTHKLIETTLLKVVKDFDSKTSDPTYTMGVVTLLLDCLQLSCLPESGGVKLRDDLRKADGYQMFVQLAFKLYGSSKDEIVGTTGSTPGGEQVAQVSSEGTSVRSGSAEESVDGTSSNVPPSLLRLFDFLVELSQVGEYEGTTVGKGGKSAGTTKPAVNHARCLPLFDGPGAVGLENRERDVDGKIRDPDALQVLQDIFLKSGNLNLQLEVLDRLLRLFSSHPDNYALVQELRTIPVFVQNMATFPAVLQERLLKVLEYAVTVVNCIPEQELLSLCCLLQQPLDSTMQAKILSFFVKLLSFDRQYKKVFREVGLLDLLLDDLRLCELPVSDAHQHHAHHDLESLAGSTSTSIGHLRPSGGALVQERSTTVVWSEGEAPANLHIFGDTVTVAGAWECLHSLLKTCEGSQTVFRKAGGIGVILPLLVSGEHRPGALRVLSGLILEDMSQAHPEELARLVRILKTELVTSISGRQWSVGIAARTDIMWTVCRILSTSVATKGVFGEAKGFSLLITVFQSLKVKENHEVETEGKEANLHHSAWELVDALMHTMIAGTSANPVNRIRLHENISSQTFKRLLTSSGLLCPVYEERLIDALFDLALEQVHNPSRTSDNVGNLPLLVLPKNNGGDMPLKVEEVYEILDEIFNPGAIEVLIHTLPHISPKLQLKVLARVEKLAHAGARNQDSLTSVGCVGLLLDTVRPLLGSSSSLMTSVLQIIEVLGVYRLSSSEFRLLGRYIWQNRETAMSVTGKKFLEVLERMSRLDGLSHESIALSPFVEFSMMRNGHASMRISLGERSWPPGVGYSFACWVRYKSLERKGSAGSEAVSNTVSLSKATSDTVPYLRLLTVGTVEEKSTMCAELYMNESGILTLATSPTSYLSFKGVRLEEGVWYHLVVVHSKPNALAGLFQSSVAYLYVNGSLRHTGKLGYTASAAGKPLQITIGTAAAVAEACPLTWRLGPCYLFEEVLSPPAIFFLFALGRGYRGTFQDTDLLRFVPYEACGGGNLAILEALETEVTANSNVQKGDGSRGSGKSNNSGIVWDLERLAGYWLQLSSKKLIFAFDGTHPFTTVKSSAAAMYNLVDPVSAAASPSGGLPRLARLHGDVYICTPCSIGDNMRSVGGVAAVLALIEAAESREMLRCALSLLVCVLRSNPRNLRDMLSCRGYHLLALFLHRRMALFKVQDLDLLFQIAACEASPFLPSSKAPEPPSITLVEASPSGSAQADLEAVEYAPLKNNDDQASSFGSFDQSDLFAQDEAMTAISEPGTGDASDRGQGSSFVLSNPEMMEHVLLDWTLWVTAPIPIQHSLLGFIERLVAMHCYRVHNLTVLRRINIVQHLLVTLQRGDVETPILDKLVVLLGILLEDGFLPAELKYVADFVVMTFDPPDHVSGAVNVTRERMGVQVIVRNMLLGMLIDLQMTIVEEDVLDTWHKIVSSKLITFLLDEAVHPTTMRWVMTLLGVCLSSSPMFSAKFRSSGGYQALVHVLPSFYDSPEVYYALFCLVFGKPVYPRVPEVRMLDFHALMPNDGSGSGELFFTDLLESIIAMAKAVFDRMRIICQKAQETGDFTQFNGLVAGSFCDSLDDTSETLQGEALLHKTYAARLMSGDTAAPGMVTSLLRFMVDLTKMCHPFSVACRRADFLETCVELYFSCASAASAIQAGQLAAKQAQELSNEAQNLQMWSGNGEQESHLESSKTVTSGEGNVLGMENDCSEDIFVDPFADYSSEDLEKFSKVFNSEDNISLVESQGTQLQTNLKPPLLGGTDSVEFKIDSIGGNGSPAPSEVSGATTGISAFKAPELESWSPKILGTPWFGGFTGSDLSSRLRTASSLGASSTPKSDCEVQDINAVGINYARETSFYPVKPQLLLKLDSAGTGGGPCSAGASAVLDLLAEIFGEVLTEFPKGAVMMETALEAVPLYADSDAFLVFQGLCLNRVINILERRLQRDDEEVDKKLDKTRWAPNLEMLSTMLVDRVYAGAFADPSGPLTVLEFLLEMLQMANKDKRVEEAIPSGKSLLSLTRGGYRQVEPYVQALLKNTNRMLMYAFCMSDANRQFQDAQVGSFCDLGLGASHLDTLMALKLILANSKLILCPSNMDADFTSCLCVNVAPLLWVKRPNIQNLAVEVWKALVLHRGPSLEEVLICKGIQGEVLDIVHGGFNKLSSSEKDFRIWVEDAQDLIKRTLEQRAKVTWKAYVTAAGRFPAVKVKALETRRKREMDRRSSQMAKSQSRHEGQRSERRFALVVVREAMAAELRVMRQDKYGWVLHAESEWSGHFQELVHERGIWPRMNRRLDPEWQLCATEGPYRMRKKLERCRIKLDPITRSSHYGGNLFEDLAFPGELENQDHGSIFHMFSVNQGEHDHNNPIEAQEYEDVFEDDGGSASLRTGLSDEQKSSVPAGTNPSVNSMSNTKSAVSVDGSFRTETPGVDSTRPSSADAGEDFRNEGKKPEKVIIDDGEYLIRPHLVPGEKIRFRYNCERVVGLDKHDGIFLIGEQCLYVIEHYYIDDEGRINEKAWEGELSIIDRALGVKINSAGAASLHEPERTNSMNEWSGESWPGGRAWAYSGGAWGKEMAKTGKHISHTWRMWKLESVHELLKRRYQLRPVAIELFSMDGCNELLVFHKAERDEVFKNLLAMNLPRNSLLDTTISGVSKQEGGEGGRLFKMMAKSFSKRWQNGEISNFQYLMHLNTLAGRGYNDLTQYPVFPWILADYESQELDLSNPATFRRLDKPMGALSREREEEFRKRYESWEDPEIPRFHYGSHYSSAGSVLFYLIRLPPFTLENRQLQGGQFDHADRLFNSLRDTWLSASQGNTADVKELIPEFFYLPEFLENRFKFDFGVKQSGEKVDDVILPPWAKGSAREFVCKHREALESQYVSENLHHWIDLIFGYRQRGKPAVDATNVFFYLTYEGAVDIDSISDPSMKASILAQINHFGQTPRQLFVKPHPKRKWHPQTLRTQSLRLYHLLIPNEIRTLESSVSQIVMFHDKIYVVGSNQVLKPPSYSKYLAWGYQDRTLRFLSYDQDKLLSTHEGLHDCGPVRCAGIGRDGRVLVTGGEDGVVAVWRLRKDGLRGSRRLHLQRALCAHSKSVTCLSVCQPYSLVVTGSLDKTVIFWDLTSLEFVRQLPELPAPASAVHTNDMTGEVVTAAGTTLAVWSINGDCLAMVKTSQISSDCILSIASPHISDWMEVSWYVTGHQNGSIKLWRMKYSNLVEEEGFIPTSRPVSAYGGSRFSSSQGDFRRGCFTGGMTPEYQLVLYKLLSWHNEPVTAICLSSDLKLLISGDGAGHVISWNLPEEGIKQASTSQSPLESCSSCMRILAEEDEKGYCRNCGQISCRNCCSQKMFLDDLGYFYPVPVCRDCFDSRKSQPQLECSPTNSSPSSSLSHHLIPRGRPSSPRQKSAEQEIQSPHGSNHPLSRTLSSKLSS